MRPEPWVRVVPGRVHRTFGPAANAAAWPRCLAWPGGTASSKVDGTWTCRLGLHVYDTHDDLTDAVTHCSTLAANNPPSEVLVHRLDSKIEKVATF